MSTTGGIEAAEQYQACSEREHGFHGMRDVWEARDGWAGVWDGYNMPPSDYGEPSGVWWWMSKCGRWTVGPYVWYDLQPDRQALDQLLDLQLRESGRVPRSEEAA